jgi:hypothetical protein
MVRVAQIAKPLKRIPLSYVIAVTTGSGLADRSTTTRTGLMRQLTAQTAC